MASNNDSVLRRKARVRQAGHDWTRISDMWDKAASAEAGSANLNVMDMDRETIQHHGRSGISHVSNMGMICKRTNYHGHGLNKRTHHGHNMMIKQSSIAII